MSTNPKEKKMRLQILIFGFLDLSEAQAHQTLQIQRRNHRTDAYNILNLSTLARLVKSGSISKKLYRCKRVALFDVAPQR
jgi:hypothetical protein